MLAAEGKQAGLRRPATSLTRFLSLNPHWTGGISMRLAGLLRVVCASPTTVCFEAHWFDSKDRGARPLGKD